MNAQALHARYATPAPAPRVLSYGRRSHFPTFPQLSPVNIAMYSQECTSEGCSLRTVISQLGRSVGGKVGLNTAPLSPVWLTGALSFALVRRGATCADDSSM